MEPVEFGSGLRSHIAGDTPAPELSETSLGPVWQPAATTALPQRSTSAEWVRELLRARAGEQADRIWAVFDEALGATDADGRPDHRLRLRAARALLAEIYGPAAGDRALQPDDELAKHRRARQSG